MKFRLAQTAEKEALLSFLRQAPELNLFLIGDIEFYGFEQDFQTVYLSDTAHYETVILRYLSNLVVFSLTNDYTKADIDAIIERHQITFCNAPLSNATHLHSLIKDRYDYRPTSMARMTSTAHLDADNGKASLSTVDDIPDVVDAMNLIDEFSHTRKEPRDKRIAHVTKKYTDGFATAFIIRENGKVVAHAEATAQSKLAAMVVGVYTVPGARHQGYASQVVSALCRHLLSHQKVPVLFFDNPQAATIYHRLGFVDFATWVMMPLKETK